MVSGTILIRPSIYEVLSGEFRPSSDKQHRRHTLANLALATFNKGDGVGVDIEGYTNLQYRPSWAPVESRVRCQQIPHSADWLLRLLKIEIDEIPILEIHDSTDKPNRNLVVVSNTKDLRFSLSDIESDPVHVRSYVTNLAQDVFNKLK